MAHPEIKPLVGLPLNLVGEVMPARMQKQPERVGGAHSAVGWQRRLHIGPASRAVGLASADQQEGAGRRERENLLVVLGKAGWKIKGRNGAAEILGVKPTTLLSRMKKMGLKRPA